MDAYSGMWQVYDRLMTDTDYDGWFAFVLTLMRERGAKSGRVCDAACGTGEFTIRLAKAGYDALGADISEGMLARAQDKARSAGVRAQFVRQDLRTLALPRPVEALTCMCDGVNYLPMPRDVKLFFARASEALKPGGVFVFDISTRYKLRNVLGDEFAGYDDGEVAYLWQNRWDEARATCTMDLTFFTRDSDGRYKRFDERHVQRGHTEEELRAWLALAGFGDVIAFGGTETRPPRDDDRRVFFAAVKK